MCAVRLMTRTKEHMESDRVRPGVFTSCPGDHLIHQLIHERRPHCSPTLYAPVRVLSLLGSIRPKFCLYNFKQKLLLFDICEN